MHKREVMQRSRAQCHWSWVGHELGHGPLQGKLSLTQLKLDRARML